MYTKVFQQIYDGTLASHGPWEAMVTFQQMLILSDSEGIVDMIPEAIARRSTIPVEIIRKGIAALEQPDPASRRGESDGRRIIRLDDHRDWGWQITNFVHYRDIQSNEDRREYFRNYKRKYRKDKEKTPDGTDVDVVCTGVNSPSKVGQSTNVHKSTDVDVDVDVNEVRRTKPSAPNEKISFDAERVIFHGITKVQTTAWEIAYPALDLKVEIAKAAAWLQANPKNLKKNYARYLTGWFDRAQQKAPALGGGSTKREKVY